MNKNWAENLNRHFPKEDIHIAKRYMKRCSTPLIIRELQFKTKMSYHHIPIRMAIINKTTKNKCWGEYGEKRTLMNHWWKWKLVQQRWKTVHRSLKNTKNRTMISSVQFSHSVMSDSLQPHESQHARPPCPSPTPGVYSNSCPSSRWCYPAILFSVVPFSSWTQTLPASESFPMSQLFSWGGQSTGVSALSSIQQLHFFIFI